MPAKPDLIMIKEIRQLIVEDKRLQLILLFGFIIQMVTAITALGFYHPDQHFQLLEFSSYQLGKESSATSVWELKAAIRPTFQVYCFSAYVLLCNFLTITNPYLQLTILRILLSITLLLTFNVITLYYYKNEKPSIRNWVLFLLNFSWILPYTRTLFSSEMFSTIFFFIPLFLFHIKKDKQPGFFFSLLVGLLFCIAFYIRLQMAFAIIGFGIWVLFFGKQYKSILPLAIGFIIGVLLNTYLDFHFYHQWVFTPYNYYHENIVLGKAASFGTSSFLVYILLLIAVIGAPPFSLVLFYYGLKSGISKYFSHPVFLTVLFFIIGHCMVSHKEERFLFSVFNMLPIIVGWGLPALFSYLQTAKKWISSFIRGLFYFSISLNILLVILFSITPYSQTVSFGSNVDKLFSGNPVKIYCTGRTLYQTESGLNLTFYKKGVHNISIQRFGKIDSLRQITGSNLYFASTYNQIKDSKPMIDSLGYKPVCYSSVLLWNINEFLDSKHINTINDIWVLYKKN